MRRKPNPQIPKDVPMGYFQFTHQRVAAKAAKAGTAGIIQSALREAEKPKTKKFSKTNQTKSAAQSWRGKERQAKIPNTESGSVRSVKWTGSFQSPNSICQEERPEASAPVPETRPKISSPKRTRRGYPGMTLSVAAIQTIKGNAAARRAHQGDEGH